MQVVTGIDVVEVERFRTVLLRTPTLAERVFTEAERDSAKGRPAQLAGRFAVKEAALKALGVGIGAVPLRELEVVSDPSGAPRLELGPGAAALADRRGWSSVSCSISHERSVAVAVVVALVV